MNYGGIVRKMIEIMKDDTTYRELFFKGSIYALYLARLESARHTRDPRLAQIELDTQGRYSDFAGAIIRLNEAVKVSHPELPSIPTSPQDLGVLVSDLLEQIRTNRIMA